MVGISELPEEVLLVVFENLDPKWLVRASGVCRTWFKLARDGILWRRICERKWKTKNLSFQPPDPTVWRKIFFHRKFGRTSTLMARPIEASSTDFPDQGILNTLVDDGRYYWSSEGTSDEDSNETLKYQLTHPICLVQSIGIEFYRADWQDGHPVYSSKALRASFYLGSHLMETISLGPVAKSSDPQEFPLPHPVVANRVALHLDGRTGVQPSDELYYTVVQFVEIRGFPLPAFKDREICQALVNHAGKFITAADLEESLFPVKNFANTLEFYLTCPTLKKSLQALLQGNLALFL